jgi:BirA family biotin operon repressor/biotin-[acetyl-CoA-carboxylase] ligase
MIKREFFEKIGSTNEYAKSQRCRRENLLVIAEKQTGGKGTKGRSFSSNAGGVYLSKLTFYEDFKACDAFKIMTNAAVAVCKTLQAFGFDPKIKWVNDIYVNDKKICGILIENVFSGDKISSSVVGIGLNVYNELPQELSAIATTMQKESGKLFSVEDVRETLVKELANAYGIDEYRAYLGYMGSGASVIFGEKICPCTLLSVDEKGNLHVEIDGEERTFAAAEVSLRL